MTARMGKWWDYPDLFQDAAHYPNRAGAKEPTTSRDAASRMDAGGRERKLRQRCLDAFRSGWQGTADELAAELGKSVLSIRPRVAQLHALGEIERTGIRHTNVSGAPAHVWRLAKTVTARAG